MESKNGPGIDLNGKSSVNRQRQGVRAHGHTPDIYVVCFPSPSYKYSYICIRFHGASSSCVRYASPSINLLHPKIRRCNQATKGGSEIFVGLIRHCSRLLLRARVTEGHSGFCKHRMC